MLTCWTEYYYLQILCQTHFCYKTCSNDAKLFFAFISIESADTTWIQGDPEISADTCMKDQWLVCTSPLQRNQLQQTEKDGMPTDAVDLQAFI